jgi:hypothetical protein
MGRDPRPPARRRSRGQSRRAIERSLMAGGVSRARSTHSTIPTLPRPQHHMKSDDLATRSRGSDRTPNGPRRASGSAARPPLLRRRARSDPNGEGAAQTQNTQSLTSPPCRAQRSFTRSAKPPQDGLRRGGCLTCHPRGASRARHGRYEVNLPVAPAGTPSARTEALLLWLRLPRPQWSATRRQCRCARWRGE